MKKYAVIVAGGSGSRMQSELPKQFMLLNGKPILMHTMEQFHLSDASIELILVLPTTQIPYWTELCKTHRFSISHQVISGGASRFESVKSGISMVSANSLVAIHDGVRPLVSTAIIDNSFVIAEQKGTAITAVALKDSIREKHKLGTRSKARDNYYLVQTPQTFKSNIIKTAYEASIESKKCTDDASVLEPFGVEIALIEGNYRNLKITTPEDLIIAQALIQNV